MNLGKGGSKSRNYTGDSIVRIVPEIIVADIKGNGKGKIDKRKHEELYIICP